MLTLEYPADAVTNQVRDLPGFQFGIYTQNPSVGNFEKSLTTIQIGNKETFV